MKKFWNSKLNFKLTALLQDKYNVPRSYAINVRMIQIQLVLPVALLMIFDQ